MLKVVLFSLIQVGFCFLAAKQVEAGTCFSSSGQSKVQARTTAKITPSESSRLYQVTEATVLLPPPPPTSAPRPALKLARTVTVRARPLPPALELKASVPIQLKVEILEEERIDPILPRDSISLKAGIGWSPKAQTNKVQTNMAQTKKKRESRRVRRLQSSEWKQVRLCSLIEGGSTSPAPFLSELDQVLQQYNVQVKSSDSKEVFQF